MFAHETTIEAPNSLTDDLERKLMNNEKVKQMLECVFMEDIDQAAAGRPFVDLNCWDSLRYVQLVVSVQATFEIELDQSQILRIITLQGLYDVLKEHGIAL